MTKHKTDFDYLQRQKEKAEQKLRYYQHQEKNAGAPDTRVDSQSPNSSPLHPRRNAGKFF